MTEHDSNPLDDGDAVRRMPADAQDLERTIVASGLAESFRESMELLAKETRELRVIAGPPVADTPRTPRAPMPPAGGRTITTVVTTAVAGGLVLMLGGFAYVAVDRRPPVLAD